MFNNFFVLKCIVLLFLIFFLNSCSSSSSITNKSSTSKTSSNYSEGLTRINLNELNKSSANVIKQFTEAVRNNSKKKKFLLELSKYINTPYKYGGQSKKGMDCSGFTQTVYKNSLNVNLPRTAREQFKFGKKIGSKKELKFGDLVYFDTSDIYFPGHVGIFLDKSLFAHASFSKGVIISSLNNTYYVNKYIGATRIKIKKTKIKR